MRKDRALFSFSFPFSQLNKFYRFNYYSVSTEENIVHRSTSIEEYNPVNQSLMAEHRSIGQRLLQINLFDTETNDEHLKRNEILSTRVYIIIIVTVLSLFTFYASLQSETKLFVISAPSLEQYEKLQMKFNHSLLCPCEQISISYEQFIEINVLYDEICSSDFISQKWIDYLFYENTSYYFQLDFRQSASAEFQILRTLCEQTRKTMNDSLTEFYSLQMITKQLTPTSLFDVQVDSFVQLFQQTTLQAFQNLLKLVRQTITGNVLFSAIEKMSVYQFDEDNSLDFSMHNIFYYDAAQRGKYFDCYCDQFVMCQLPEGIYAHINRYDFAGSNWVNGEHANASTTAVNATFLVPGMITGCMSMESLMYSTGECLSERTCLDRIGFYMNYSSIPIQSFSLLNQSHLTRNRTIETLANNLFVQSWIVNKSYDKYFSQCQPAFCQYNDHHKNPFIQILASVISLYGGLRVAFTFIIPVIIAFIRKKHHNEDQRNAHVELPESKFGLSQSYEKSVQMISH